MAASECSENRQRTPTDCSRTLNANNVSPSDWTDDGQCGELTGYMKRHHYSLDSGWSWVVLAGSCLAQIIVSSIYVVGIFNVIFLEVFQKDRQTTAWLGAVQSSCLSLFGLPAGYINSKLGPRVTTIIGALCGSVGFLLAYFSNGYLSLLLTFGFLVGVGISLINLSSIIITGFYFKRYRNLAFAASTSTVGLGTLLLPLLINYCTEVYGWRGCMLIMSGMYLQLLVVGGVMRPQHIPSRFLEKTVPAEREKKLQLQTDALGQSIASVASVSSVASPEPDLDRNAAVRFKYSSWSELSRSSLCHRQLQPASCSRSHGDLALIASTGRWRAMQTEGSAEIEDARRASSGPESTETDGSGQDRKPDGRAAGFVRSKWLNILRNRNLMLLNFHYFSATAANFIGYLHFPAYFIEKTASKADISLMMTLVGISNSLGRLLSGALTSGTDTEVLLVYLGAGGLVGITLFLCPIMACFHGGRMVFAVAFSFYGNAISGLRAAMTLELCSLEELSLAFGVELFIGGISGLLGPPFAGWLYDVSGDYVVSFVFAGCLYMLGTLVMMLLPLLNKRTR